MYKKLLLFIYYNIYNKVNLLKINRGIFRNGGKK